MQRHLHCKSQEALELEASQWVFEVSYSHLFNKRGGWNKREGGAKVAKSLNVEAGINVEGGFFGKN